MAMKKKPTKKTTTQKSAAKKAAVRKAPAKKAAPKKKAAKKAAPKKKAAKKAAPKKKTTRKLPSKKGAPALTKAESQENLRHLIGRALTDKQFRALVMKSPEKALQQYPLLNPEKKAVLKAIENRLAAGKAIDRLIDNIFGPRGAI